MDVTITSDQHLCWMSNTATSGGNAPNGQTIVEFSGICDSGINPNTFYVHEDSGNGAWFYAYDYDGTLKKCIQIDTSVNGVAYGDLEDMCYHQSTHTIWLANCGDSAAMAGNSTKDGTFVVMKFNDPDLTGSNPSTILTLSPTVYRFAWPSNVPHNCEAMMISPSGRLYFVSKETSTDVTWPTQLYQAPSSLAAYPTVNQLTSVATWTQYSAITAGDWSSDGKLIVTRNHGGSTGGHLNFYDPTDFSFIKSINTQYVQRDNSATSMAESLCFTKDNTAILAGTEGNGCETRILTYTTPSAPGGNAPAASFTANPSNVVEDTPVAFTDTSTNTPTSWAWTFGDGGTSTAQNPSHTYANPGQYTAQLVATNAFGSNSTTKTITVLAAVQAKQVWKSKIGGVWKAMKTWSNPINKKIAGFVNLLSNPDFETSSLGTQGWGTSSTGTLTRSTSDPAKEGTASLKNTITLASGTAFYVSDQVACSEGDVFSAAAWLRWKTGATPRSVRVDIQFYDASRVLVTGGTFLGTSVASNTSSYVQATKTNVVAPAGSVNVRMRVSILSTVAGEEVLLDAAQLEKSDTLTPYPPPTTETITPYWSDLVDYAHGVNTHFTFSGVYDQYAAVTSLIIESGIRNVRDKSDPDNTAQQAAFAILGAAGVKMLSPVYNMQDMPVTDSDIDHRLTPMINHPTWWRFIAGANEVQSTDTLRPANWDTDARNYQQRLWNRVNAAGLRPGIKVVGPSLQDLNIQGTYASNQEALAADYAALGATGVSAYMDVADYHRYPTNNQYATPTLLQADRQGMATSAYGKSMTNTEGGYWHGPFDTGPNRFPADVVAAYAVRLWFELFNMGVVCHYWYQFMSYPNPGNDDPSSWWGLIDVQQSNAALTDPSGWTKTQAFNAIKARHAELKDIGGGYTPDNPFSPAPVQVSIDTGGVTNVHHLLVAKRDGSVRLYLWRDQALWDTTNNVYISNPSTPVTVKTATTTTIYNVDGYITNIVLY